MAHPRELLGSEVYEQMKRDIAAAEAQLSLAQQHYDLAVSMGVASAEDSKVLQDTKRRLAQMKAGLKL